jgi:very-short-patch-repair endonuclease
VGVKVRFNRTIAKTSWARRLRQNAPEAEARLWYYLRNRHLGVDFRRHHPAGRYVLDFYCPALRLAIEVDGGQYASTRVAKRDQMRTRWLAERGVTSCGFGTLMFSKASKGLLRRSSTESGRCACLA